MDKKDKIFIIVCIILILISLFLNAKSNIEKYEAYKELNKRVELLETDKSRINREIDKICGDLKELYSHEAYLSCMGILINPNN